MTMSDNYSSQFKTEIADVLNWPSILSTEAVFIPSFETSTCEVFSNTVTPLPQ